MRHVVLIVADDWRGVPTPGARAPRIESLRAKSVSFDAAYAQYPLCNPSRASMLTGRRPVDTGIFDLEGRVDQRGLGGVDSLPMFLARQRFRIIASGKVFHGETDPRVWHEIAHEPVKHPFQQSLCTHASYERLESQPAHVAGRAILEDAMCKVADLNRTLDVQIARSAVRAIRHHIETRPMQSMFVAVGLVSTHLPWMTADRFWDEARSRPKVEDDALDVPRDWRAPPADLVSDGVSFETSRVRGRPFTFRTVDDQTRVAFRAGYRAAIAQLDYAVGMVLDGQTAAGIQGQTLVILTADHGFALGEDGHYGKRSLNEVSTRVPLVVHCPWPHAGLHERGLNTATPVESLRLYRSVAALLGIEDRVASQVDGTPWWLASAAVSQVARCVEAICPTDMSPLSKHLVKFGTSLRRGHGRLT